MKIYSIIKEDIRVSNAQELADAFDAEEWIKIANHFIKNSDMYRFTLGDNRDQINARMRRINSRVGSDQPASQTPADWNFRAREFGMHMQDVPGQPSWSKIYKHLSDALEDAELPGEYFVPGLSSSASMSPDTDDTPEDYYTDIADWVEGFDRDHTWDNYETCAEEYLRPWFAVLMGQDGNEGKRGEDFPRWLSQTYDTNQPNAARQMLDTVKRRISQAIEDNGQIKKSDIDKRLFGWLQSADSMYRRWRNEQDEDI